MYKFEAEYYNKIKNEKTKYAKKVKTTKRAFLIHTLKAFLEISILKGIAEKLPMDVVTNRLGYREREWKTTLHMLDMMHDNIAKLQWANKGMLDYGFDKQISEE